MPVQWVSDTIIGQLFNAGQYQERLERGELHAKVKESSAPKTLPPGLPPGTLSQIVVYLDSRNKAVALIHQYLTPSGVIGASGKPDPKALFFDDHIVKYDRKKKEKRGQHY